MPVSQGRGPVSPRPLPETAVPEQSSRWEGCVRANRVERLRAVRLTVRDQIRARTTPHAQRFGQGRRAVVMACPDIIEEVGARGPSRASTMTTSSRAVPAREQVAGSMTPAAPANADALMTSLSRLGPIPSIIIGPCIGGEVKIVRRTPANSLEDSVRILRGHVESAAPADE